MIKVGIVGGTGYTGVELLRLLAVHPQAEIAIITSREETGKHVAELYPSLRGYVDINFSAPDSQRLQSCDVVFFATPHNVAMKLVPELLENGTRVIDLSADFRIKDHALWSQWYGEPHLCPDLLGHSVYGLPEMYREEIKSARLVACPGCYPTTVQLGFLPLLENKLVDLTGLIANSASGVSGAGRQAKVDNLYAEVGDSYKAYAVAGHRHLPEIEQGLATMAGEPVKLTFVPHLLPIIRGIHSTLYATLLDSSIDLQSLYEERFAGEPFVDVMQAGSHPQTRSVKGSNCCRIAVHRPQGGNKAVILVVEDNLVKGASGQAIQNMNLMFDIDETTGLAAPAMMP
ncbi:MAG: N-acetyl-gamma-glutamyl-phosphate reductase [Gammaproteobacteria bacterium]|nr:N-acetyl-gamma-glutamyl-phosphate reductase [Gammaproteobacteria bacterium]